MGGPVRGTADREARRAELRGRRRRHRRIAIGGVAAVALVATAIAVSRPFSDSGGTAAAPPPATTGAAAGAVASATDETSTEAAAKTASTNAPPAATASSSTAPATTAKSPPSTATTTASVPRLADLHIDQNPIPYGAGRLGEMAGYAERHYGIRSSRLDPQLIVLHYTAGDSYRSAWSTFASDTPAGGPAGSAVELPGTCAHFIVDQQGTIHQLVPLTVQCRHTIGLNRWAIGIEMVQSDAGHDSLWATDQILHRRKQIGAVLALVRALMARYDLHKTDVIGHGTANDDPRFVDLEGWRNDHTDWLAPAVKELRGRL